MNKWLLSFSFAGLFAFSSLQAQVTTFPYQFSAFNEPYLPLENPISLDQGLVWDDPELMVTLPFEWVIFEDTITQFIVGGPGAQVLQNYYTEDTIDAVIPYFADIINVNDSIVVSPIGYEIVGNAPNRICKIQWSNVGFYEEWMNTGLAGNTFSFQFWIYEGSNSMRIHFGPTFIKSANPFQDFGLPCVMFIDEFDLMNQTWSGMWTLSGPANSPQVVSVAAFGPMGLDSTQLLLSDPQEGQVYFFENLTPIGVIESEFQTIKWYPNPAGSQACFYADQRESYSLLNAQGIAVYSFQSNPGLNSIDVSQFSEGLYFLHSDEHPRALSKLMVQHR